MGFRYPEIGAWYRDNEQQQLFEVVAIDDDLGAIEVQYLDGAIDEFDVESWPQLTLSPAAPPEDSDAGYELSQEDRWSDDAPYLPVSDNPLTTIEPDLFGGFDDF
ncbi:DUF6763 family protein [Marinimicrobium alkaliphilum]|uniref:DUF6763 family protein n=1 Tax=Marinimicrobium alkaliphilum TaxID=2202654 RepID=UPI000DBA3CB8|nr:DUF6763 family protein [Marinimicrobium alkaliphilum]